MGMIIVGLIGFVIGVIVVLLIYRNNTKKLTAILNTLKQGGDANDLLKNIYKILK